MTFAAHMRLGSVEVMLAMAVFAIAGLRVRRFAVAGASDAAMMLELEVAERDVRRRVEGSCPFVVGRSSEADLLILDPEVSRRHARFENDGRTIFLTDLHSSNGTFLNGRRIEETIEMRPGDYFDVGTARITLVGSKPCN
jgi:FHA domain